MAAEAAKNQNNKFTYGGLDWGKADRELFPVTNDKDCIDLNGARINELIYLVKNGDQPTADLQKDESAKPFLKLRPSAQQRAMKESSSGVEASVPFRLSLKSLPEYLLFEEGKPGAGFVGINPTLPDDHPGGEYCR